MLQILKFGATWCGPCKALNTIILDAIKETGVDIKSYDADTDQELCQKYAIRAVPTLIFLKNNLEVARKTGLISKSDLVNMIEQYN